MPCRRRVTRRQIDSAMRLTAPMQKGAAERNPIRTRVRPAAAHWPGRWVGWVGHDDPLQPALRCIGLAVSREPWVDGFEVFLLLEDFAALALVFFVAERLVLLCFAEFVAGVAGATAGALLSGAGAAAPPVDWASAPVGSVLAARKARSANAEINVFIRGSWIEITNRRFSRTWKECG